MADDKLQVIAHRSNTRGPELTEENTRWHISQAQHSGFQVEFDVSESVTGSGLVISHEPNLPTVGNHFGKLLDDFVLLQANPHLKKRHFLDIKETANFPEVRESLEKRNLQSALYILDYELLSRPSDRRGTWEYMRRHSERGFLFAHRVSDREPFLNELVKNDSVSALWMDELDSEWITYEHIARAEDLGKSTYVCSPDITPAKSKQASSPEGVRDHLVGRWEQLISWGCTGICTDYAVDCRDLATQLGR